MPLASYAKSPKRIREKSKILETAISGKVTCFVARRHEICCNQLTIDTATLGCESRLNTLSQSDGGVAMNWRIDKPVVVPFDFSDHAMAALERAVLVADSPALVHVVHVLPFMIPTEPGVVWATVDDASRIDHALKSMNEMLPPEKFGNLQLEVRLGD
ncbi:MAG TPA: hypothetical protein DDW52_02580, partial [Planctomycetaceae bacterium]|nr:hypothetical protein [Planctomycetaceae bacterium]